MGKTCFFIGHRDAPDSLTEELEKAVERHISEYGVTEFTVGRYGRFDALAAKAVRWAKERHSGLQLLCLRPYHPAEQTMETPTGFDGSFYPPGMACVPRRLAIIRANHYLVDNSDFLIAYAPHPGNARKLVEYARRREQRGFIKVTTLPEN